MRADSLVLGLGSGLAHLLTDVDAQDLRENTKTHRNHKDTSNHYSIKSPQYALFCL